jgi:hypothetical protein
MRDSRESGPHSWSRRNFCRLIFLELLLLVAFLSAQSTTAPATLPKYDLQTETKIKGTVEEVKMPPAGSKKEAVHLMVKSGADTLDIYLCPKPFLDDMGMEFTKGDEISITGSKVKQGDTELVLAREVVKGNNTFVLRDGKGVPVWG